MVVVVVWLCVVGDANTRCKGVAVCSRGALSFLRQWHCTLSRCESPLWTGMASRPALSCRFSLSFQ